MCIINENHMMYGSWDMEHVTDIIFCHFFIRILKKWKKRPGDIIILHMCTLNGNHIRYGSWDIERDGQSSFFILHHFWLFYLPNNLKKIKILKKWKKLLEILSFYTRVQKIMIICYTVPEIWCLRVVVIFNFEPYFSLLPP